MKLDVETSQLYLKITFIPETMCFFYKCCLSCDNEYSTKLLHLDFYMSILYQHDPLFKIFNGVKQGSVISPLLFTLYIDSLFLITNLIFCTLKGQLSLGDYFIWVIG